MPHTLMNDLQAHNGPIRQEIDSAISAVLDSGRYLLGSETEGFESEFGQFCGMANCIAVANGSDALELLLRGVGIEPDDEVLTVANAGMYATRAIMACGAWPVFVDVQADSLNLDPQAIEQAITPKTRAVIATHLYGRMAAMPAICQVAKKHNLVCLEDCAQAHGATLDGIAAGAWGDGAAFSFYPSKNLGALGDGGAILVKDSGIAARVRRLRQYGWSSKYHYSEVGGRNSRMDEIQAAVLRVKLAHLPGWNVKRRNLAAVYESSLSHPAIVPQAADGADYVAHLYVVRTVQRDSFTRHLKQHGVAHEIHYPLLDYRQPELRQRYRAQSFPVSEQCESQVVSLPCYPELELADLSSIIEIVNQWQP